MNDKKQYVKNVVEVRYVCMDKENLNVKKVVIWTLNHNVEIGSQGRTKYR